MDEGKLPKRSKENVGFNGKTRSKIKKDMCGRQKLTLNIHKASNLNTSTHKERGKIDAIYTE